MTQRVNGLEEIEKSARISREAERHASDLNLLLEKLAHFEPANGSMIWLASTLARRAADQAVKDVEGGFDAPVELLHARATMILKLLAQNPR